ncbi:hypothetical protein EON79_15725 [bacterium]|nr:MAG: hypothetical protein EON79_15725 [bacterium]
MGGLRVGDSMEEAWKRLGDAHGDDPRKAWEPGPGSISTWLDGGLRVCHFANRIKWIEFARSKDLLMEGTTAYVPRNAARLYLAECTPGDGPVLGSRAEIARTLAASNAVRLVDTQEDADLVLNLRVSPFREKKEKVIDAIPLSYECTVELEYDLYDTEKGTYLVRGKSSSSTSKANYEREAGLGFLGLVATLTNKNDVVKLIGGALGVAGVAELQKTMSRARERCPQYAARGAFAPVMAEIAKGADFAVRVTDIDHLKNIVTINAGTRQGIRVHSEAEPSEFEVSVGGQPLPSKVGGLTAEYSVLRVIAVHDDTAECELVKVRRSVDRVSDKVKVTPDTDSLRTLPRASTAIVSAIAMVRFARD